MDWKLSLLSFLATAFLIKLVASQAATEPYDFSELKFYNVYVTYDVASRACKNDKAELVVIKNETLQNVITNTLATIRGPWNTNQWYDGYWIGGKRNAETTTWLWSDGSPVPPPRSTRGYQKWFGAEPNSFTRDNGCIAVTPRDTIYSNHNVRGGWLDDVCNANRYYLCRRQFCVTNPCQNNGICVAEPRSYFCNCTSEYMGTHCETRNYCSTNPCVRGTCINLENDYKCDCESGYIGKDCDRNYCTSNNCTNGATCMVKPTNYTCNCSTEYIGTYCEIRDFCREINCQNGATCVNQPTTFKCNCNGNYIGTYCENINYCASNPCVNGTCRNLLSTYECVCEERFSGKDCDIEHFSDGQGCSIHFGNDYASSFKQAKEHCRSEGSSIAIVKSLNTESFIRSINRDTSNDLWIGAQYVNDEWQWLDGSGISLSRNNASSRFLATYNSSQAGQCLSLTSNRMEWTAQDCQSQRGYICEKLENGKTDPCDSASCMNGGSCIGSGCHYSCDCLPGYNGSDCSIVIPSQTSGTTASSWLIPVIVVVGILILLIIVIVFVKRRVILRKFNQEAHSNLENGIEFTETKEKKPEQLTNGAAAVQISSSASVPQDPVPDQADSPVYGNVGQDSKDDYAIANNQLHKRYKEMISSPYKPFEKQFKRDLVDAVADLHNSCDVGNLEMNRTKNRFKNIVAYDVSRVVLSKQNDIPGSDYINANYVDCYDVPKQYIATQGPKPCTVGDFWRMIMEENCSVIVMLANIKENGKLKCAKYWADENMSCHHNDIKVTTKLENVGDFFVVREFEVTHKQEIRKVTQLHYTDWPDHGVPPSTEGLHRLYRKTMDIYNADCSPAVPIVVHCSAGAGRTGTFIGFDSLQREMHAKSSVNVFGAVLNMRRQRKYMVQTLEQYILLYKLITESYALGNTDLDTINCTDILSELYTDNTTIYENI